MHLRLANRSSMPYDSGDFFLFFIIFPMKKTLLALLMALGLMTLPACSGTPEDTDMEDDTPMEDDAMMEADVDADAAMDTDA